MPHSASLRAAMGAAFLAALPMAPAAMAANFTPPAGCALDMTVQNRGCTVTQVYSCDADPEDWQRTAMFDRDGLYYLSTIDGETRWIESQSTRTGIMDRLVENAEDDASFSDLVQTGSDSFDFWTQSTSGELLHHVGRDSLTGETVEIDGETLERTRFQLTTSDGSGKVLIERHGGQYISRDHGRFFGGLETARDWTGKTNKTDDSPAAFAHPGEAGFGDTTPQFDCDQLLSQIPQERAAS
ncbi:hypothetical protein Q4511_03245 [Paracoccus sp. 1_MG-2023]|uniref:hypothetical protein n=1 Tax=unclassified Paracoccus (in: a-proteobacteria) TaxID=2688777 RepID=UPI001C09A36C|nr:MULTISPECIES: hypothetical protein [unclassified Paracoccus (in: a-proteobacteria)]MBU2956251.1 hypothetical protein [Paracoccus sp. C2R09]MDO6667928.1 hypothetical protein [Paracoccus sp. 1_MG-2023]